jgi:hypothetical protein
MARIESAALGASSSPSLFRASRIGAERAPGRKARAASGLDAGTDDAAFVRAGPLAESAAAAASASPRVSGVLVYRARPWHETG